MTYHTITHRPRQDIHKYTKITRHIKIHILVPPPEQARRRQGSSGDWPLQVRCSSGTPAVLLRYTCGTPPVATAGIPHHIRTISAPVQAQP